MVRRLDKRGVVTSRVQQDGRRQVRYYTCTEAGQKFPETWLGPPFADNISVTIDPLRTRMLYLELLTPKQRTAWLDQSEQILQQPLSSKVRALLDGGLRVTRERN